MHGLESILQTLGEPPGSMRVKRCTTTLKVQVAEAKAGLRGRGELIHAIYGHCKRGLVTARLAEDRYCEWF